MYLIKNSLRHLFGHCLHQSTIFLLFFNNFIKNVGTFYQILTNYCKKKKLKNHKMATNFHHLYIISVLLLLLEILQKDFFRSQDARSNDSATSCQVSWSYLIEFFWLSSNNFYTLKDKRFMLHEMAYSRTLQILPYF